MQAFPCTAAALSHAVGLAKSTQPSLKNKKKEIDAI